MRDILYVENLEIQGHITIGKRVDFGDLSKIRKTN